MRHPKRIEPGPGQESVWDYPRPPRLERVAERLKIEVDGVTLADTTRGWRVLETSHPPVYYMPLDDLARDHLERVTGARSWCEWKGRAIYYDVVLPTRRLSRVGWAYPEPTPAFAPIRDHVAFYAGPMDTCWVGDVRATPQPGAFYGGWVTPNVVGPFKGGPGSQFW